MKTFIEIGACDFDTLVHLSDEGWQGIVVEPIREYYNNIERKPNVKKIKEFIIVKNISRMWIFFYFSAQFVSV